MEALLRVDPGCAERLSREAMGSCDDAGSFTWRHVRIRALLTLGRSEESGLLAAESLALANRLQDATYKRHFLLSLAYAELHLESYEQAGVHFREYVSICARDQDQIEVRRGLANLGILLMEARRQKEAVLIFEQTLQMGNLPPDMRASLLLNLGVSRFEAGQVEAALQPFAESVQIAERHGLEVFAGFAALNLAEAEWKLGREAEALERTLRARRQAKRIKMSRDILIADMRLGGFALQKRRYATARRLFWRVVMMSECLIRDQDWEYAVQKLVDIESERGNSEALSKLASMMAEHSARRRSERVSSRLAQAEIDRILGVTYAMAAQGSTAAVDDQRRTDAAASDLSSADALRAVFGLTPAEQRVLHHLIRGSTNVQIAEALGLSPYTVRHHVSVILSKMSVATRTEAVSVALCLRNGADVRPATIR
jgi:DNA-binding CsgD family transcriptional regulator